MAPNTSIPTTMSVSDTQSDLQEQVQNYEGPYNERMLVSFGNYLLRRYNVMVMANDGTNQPLYQREVYHADVCNWKDAEGYDLFHLPSAHQVGDGVVLSFGSEGSLNNCSVIKVHFAEEKVLYDVEVRGETNYPNGKGHSWTTRLYNVDSAFVTKRVSNEYPN